MKILLFLLFPIMGFNVNGSKMQLEVLPIPQRIKIIGNSPFIINSETRIVIEKDLRDSSKRVISYLRKEILQNFNFEPEVIQGKAKKNSVLLKIIENNKLSGFIPQDMRDQSYELSVNAEAAVIKAITQKGLFYGCVTLMQLLENYKGEIPSCEIIDWPDLKIRGISDDISRGQVSTQENFKRIIKFLARYKMNIYMPYLEDMIQFDSFPSIGKDRGALTKKEINELVEYASDYFIEVIPIFQTLGHFENVLSQKEFIKYADWPGAASLDVTNEETYKFLKSMLEEVFELFPSKYFHIGADESYDIGFGNSRKLVEETSLGRVHSDHYRRIYEICKDSGKDVMMYGDIILENPEILDNLPRDVIIVDWQYRPEADYPSAKYFMESGFDYIISPSVWNFNSVYPENFLAFPNIESLTRSGIEHNAMGMINSGWGDYGSETFRELNLHGYAWSAQCAWNIQASEIEKFDGLFFKDFYGTADSKIKEIITFLSEPVNQLLWNEVWRYPLLPPRQKDWRSNGLHNFSKIWWMKRSDYSSQINTLIKNACKNKNHLELIKFVLDFRNYFILKTETEIMLRKKIKGYPIDDDSLKLYVNANLSQLNIIHERFSELWLKYNKTDNLWMIEEKFERLRSYFEDILTSLKSNSLPEIQIRSSCIRYPNDDAVSGNARFKYSFNINSDILEAHLQFLAEGHAELYINETYIDEVYVKRSGSLWLEQQRVKFLNIKDFVKPGNNIIEVKVKNYKDKAACCNVIGLIITSEGSIDIISDENWLTNNYMNPEWINAGISNEKLEITPPNFNKLRKSWIER